MLISFAPICDPDRIVLRILHSAKWPPGAQQEHQRQVDMRIVRPVDQRPRFATVQDALVALRLRWTH